MAAEVWSNLIYANAIACRRAMKPFQKVAWWDIVGESGAQWKVVGTDFFGRGSTALYR
jgi:hypothetical protein